jgi:hypothetical protein
VTVFQEYDRAWDVTVFLHPRLWAWPRQENTGISTSVSVSIGTSTSSRTSTGTSTSATEERSPLSKARRCARSSGQVARLEQMILVPCVGHWEDEGGSQALLRWSLLHQCYNSTLVVLPVVPVALVVLGVYILFSEKHANTMRQRVRNKHKVRTTNQKTIEQNRSDNMSENTSAKHSQKQSLKRQVRKHARHKV